MRAFQSWFRYNALGRLDGIAVGPPFAILAWLFSLNAADENTVPVGQLQKSGPNLTVIDPETNKLTRLFNPRRHRWSTHFRWGQAVLIGKTAVGRTTIEVLAMNDPDRIALRQELMNQGLLST